jgi:hypothetical protein
MTAGAPSTQWKESIPPGEEARLVGYAEALRDTQRARAAGGKPGRALHTKGYGVEGELTVLDGLPDHARAGLFARPATYRAYVRYSNGDSRRNRDSKGDVRGIAVKVLGVAGKKVIPGMEDETTQDLLAIRTPALPFRDAAEFVAVVTAAQANPLLLLPRIVGRLGLGRTFEVLPRVAKGMKLAMSPLAATPYYSAAPICCGAYAVQYAFLPQDRPEPAPSRGSSPDWMRDDLARRLRDQAVVYDLRLRFYVDEARTPIEDASVEWKEDDAPAVTVARLTLPVQDLDSPRGKKLDAAVEALSFDTWHALVEHRPLGNVMRARNQAYMLSTKERGAGKEPKGTELDAS